MESFGHPWPMYFSTCLALFWYLGPPWGPDGGPDCQNDQHDLQNGTWGIRSCPKTTKKTTTTTKTREFPLSLSKLFAKSAGRVDSWAAVLSEA